MSWVAKAEYMRTFPKTFKEAVEQIRKKNGLSIAALAEEMSLDDRTLTRWLNDPSRYTDAASDFKN